MKKNILKLLVLSSVFSIQLFSMQSVSSYKKEDLEAIALSQKQTTDGILTPEFLNKMKTAIKNVRKIKDFEKASIGFAAYFDSLLCYNLYNFDKDNPEFIQLNQKYKPQINLITNHLCELRFNKPMDVLRLKSLYKKAFTDATRIQVKHNTMQNSHEPTINFRSENNYWLFTVYSKSAQLTAKYDPENQQIKDITGFDYDLVKVPFCTIL